MTHFVLAQFLRAFYVFTGIIHVALLLACITTKQYVTAAIILLPLTPIVLGFRYMNRWIKENRTA